MTLNVNSKNFKTEVLDSDKPVLVDFWAPWCGPCKMLSPLIDKLSEEIKDVKIVKFNIEYSPDIAEKYNIASIPNMMIFKDGHVKGTLLGFNTEPKIKEFIESNK